MAQIIGMRATVYGTVETMFRLSVPLADCYPDWRNVFVQLRDNGERFIHRGWGYQTCEGDWLAVLPGCTWLACCSPLSARDLAMAEAEIAAAVGNWSA